MNETSILKAFRGEIKRVPVWFMRQAGRYLPEYRALKDKHKLEDLFRNPQLACDITCMPVDILGVDAAILFADILTLPAAMGVSIHFDDRKGPIIDTSDLFKNMHDLDDIKHIRETISLVNQKLPGNIPLIGFAGSPFTVLTYLIEGGSSIGHQKTLKFIAQEPGLYNQMMEKITLNTIKYYQLQKAAGIKIFQLFDTWAGILRAQDYAHHILPYVQQVFEAVDLPSIYFVKNSSYLLALMDKVDADFLSVDHSVVIGHQKTLNKTKKGIQGNLFNGLLYADNATIAREVKDILIGAKKHGKFIFNLSHGVFPDVDKDKLKYIVELVHNFDWNNG